MRDYKNENVMSLTKDLLHVVTIVSARMINSGCALISTFKCIYGRVQRFYLFPARGIINFNKTFYSLVFLLLFLRRGRYFGFSVFFSLVLFFIIITISHERFAHCTIVFVKFDFDSSCLSSFSPLLRPRLHLSVRTLVHPFPPPPPRPILARSRNTYYMYLCTGRNGFDRNPTDRTPDARSRREYTRTGSTAVRDFRFGAQTHRWLLARVVRVIINRNDGFSRKKQRL